MFCIRWAQKLDPGPPFMLFPAWHHILTVVHREVEIPELETKLVGVPHCSEDYVSATRTPSNCIGRFVSERFLTAEKSVNVYGVQGVENEEHTQELEVTFALVVRVKADFSFDRNTRCRPCCQIRV
jgi:hypothetical protein